jgi:carboxylesterase
MLSLQNPHLEGGSFYLPGGPQGILLIHGLTATAAEVRPMALWLQKFGYTVAAPLLPGHYTQPADLNRVRWQDWAGSVEEMYACLQKDCTQIAAGGESTGAVLALNLALTHPEITALLLYATALKLKMRAIDRMKLRLLSPFVPWVKKMNADDGLPWQGYRVNPLKGVLQLLALQEYIQPRLPRITPPALIVHGRLDPTVDPEVPGILQTSLGSKIKEVAWMENSTHCVIIDREAEQVYELTQQFLERIWRKS